MPKYKSPTPPDYSPQPQTRLGKCSTPNRARLMSDIDALYQAQWELNRGELNGISFS
jgi:hypothetical protein